MDVDVEVRATWGRGMGALPWQQRLVSVDGVWADGFHPTECCVIVLWGTSKRNRREQKLQGRAGQELASKGDSLGGSDHCPSPQNL